MTGKEILYIESLEKENKRLRFELTFVRICWLVVVLSSLVALLIVKG